MAENAQLAAGVVPNSEHGGTEGHPMHIHVNDFEVISVGGVPQPPGTIHDTIWVSQTLKL